MDILFPQDSLPINIQYLPGDKMSQNPLQKYFRQPKVFISLPSKGLYLKPNMIDGDPFNLPVFSMTGMDEIIMKTPEALMSGESTVRIIQSCCPGIKNAWEISSIDIDLILAAIRIATYGNELEISSTCQHCNEENDYAVELSFLINHFSNFKFKNRVVFNDLTVKLKPLNYRQITDLSIKNYQMQRKLAVIDVMDTTHDDEKKKLVAELYADAGALQKEIYGYSIESIEFQGQIVDNTAYISEWLDNCDTEIFKTIKETFNDNKDRMIAPPFLTKCNYCGQENQVVIDMDQSNFFVKA